MYCLCLCSRYSYIVLLKLKFIVLTMFQLSIKLMHIAVLATQAYVLICLDTITYNTIILY